MPRAGLQLTDLTEDRAEALGLAQKGGARLYSQMISLYEALHDSDGPLTQGMKEVYAEQVDELKRHASELKTLLTEDLARVNELATPTWRSTPSFP